MITLKVFIQAVIIFQLNIFSNADENLNSRAARRQNARGSLRYGYNHPPAIEIYQPIPVAVVYEDVSIREDKSFEIPTKSSTTEKLQVVTTTEAVQTTTITTTLNDNETSQTESINLGKETEVPKLKLSTTFNTIEQIPVAVIYEEPIKINYRKVNNQRRNNVRLRRPEKVETDVSMTKNNLTSSESNKINLTQELKTEVGETTNETSNASNDSKRRKIQRHRPVSQVNPNVNIGHKIIPDQNISNEQQYTNSQNNKTNQEKITILNHDIVNNTTMKNKTREKDPVVPILESENHVYAQNGVFKYSYESGDGTKAFSEGELKFVDDENTGEAVAGGFSYKDKEGNDFSLTYTADENGYRPVGAHLPTPPPIPPAIARALAYLATKPTSEPVTESLDEQN